MQMHEYKLPLLPIQGLSWGSYVKYIEKAAINIAKFDTLLQSLLKPDIVISSLTVKEAVTSTQIEGTQATMSDILHHQGLSKAGYVTKDIQEVINYKLALDYAQQALHELPLSIRLIKNIHKILLKNVTRKTTTMLGVFRTGTVFIGSPGSDISKAKYVPPKFQEIIKLMERLEKYIHYREKNSLVQLAIIHAYFELIHPFWDGNGRVGRILVPVFLFYKKILSTPTFYISEYFRKYQSEYYKYLHGISKSNAWDEWVVFFLIAISEQSLWHINKVQKIHNLYNKVHVILSDHRLDVNVLDFLFSYPLFDTTRFINKTNMSPSTARRVLNKLCKYKVITKDQHAIGSKPAWFSFPDLLKIVQD